MQIETLFEGIGAGPVIACGAALGILLGVAGGESIDTTPLQRGKTLEQLIPDRYAASDAEWVDAGANMPDHYPQETRNGRVEVWELRSYILRRERPPVFDYYDTLVGSDLYAAPADEAPIAEDGAALPADHPQLVAAIVPGRLEHATLPIGDDAVLEPAIAHIARGDAISAELKRIGAP
jgi:hypothetical protein